MKKCFFLILSVLFLVTGCSSTNNEDKQQRITKSEATVEKVTPEKENAEKQRLRYEITIANEDDVRIVDSVNVIPAKKLQEHLGETVNKGIEYKEEYIKLHGVIILESNKLTKEDISRSKPYIKGLQFIGDNNKEYLLVNH